MKKLLAITLCVLALLLVTACAAKKSDSAPPTTDAPGYEAPVINFHVTSIQDFNSEFADENTVMSSGGNILSRALNSQNLVFSNHEIYSIDYSKDNELIERMDVYWHMEDCAQEFHGYGNCKWFLLTLNYSPDDLFAEINVTDFEQLDTDLYAENQYNENSLYADQTNITLYRYRLNSNYRVSFTVHNELAYHDAVVAQFVELCEDIKGWLSDDNVAA